MVDEARVQRLLRHLIDTVAFLEDEAAAPAEVRTERRWMDSIKYNFIAAIGCAIVIGQHICADEGGALRVPIQKSSRS